MNQELKTQYLSLQLKISLMKTRLLENEGTIAELTKEIALLKKGKEESAQLLNETKQTAKELEKSFKKSDKNSKIVVITENTEASKAELKKKLDKYIERIDHCIEQLRKP